MSTKLRVVVAEDEALIRLDLVEMLNESGYEVIGQAGDGLKAIELTENLNPDLVIMDIKMPKLDGISAAEKIASNRLCPVVILTAFSQKDLVEKARDAGAMAYLTKPFSMDELMPAIELAVSRFQEIKQLDNEIKDLQEQLKARKSIDQAKALLIKHLKLSEPEAFKWMQKTAMDKRRSMLDVATLVIEEYKNR
ncbi:MAG: ANTAR domain-containing response regulator [Candidatus Nanopelagicales bacterium]|jgi:two-component system, response regulator PdtaR